MSKFISSSPGHTAMCNRELLWCSPQAWDEAFVHCWKVNSNCIITAIEGRQAPKQEGRCPGWLALKPAAKGLHVTMTTQGLLD